jgi:hypothetical protein
VKKIALLAALAFVLAAGSMTVMTIQPTPRWRTPAAVAASAERQEIPVKNLILLAALVFMLAAGTATVLTIQPTLASACPCNSCC